MEKWYKRIDSDVMTKEQIWRQFPDMWVALGDIVYDDTHDFYGIISARVLYAGTDIKKIDLVSTHDKDFKRRFFTGDTSKYDIDIVSSGLLD